MTALGYALSEDSQFYTSLIDKFNQYSKENDLDIEVQFVYLSSVNVTGYYKDYDSFLEALFKKKDDRYDIYFYETTNNFNYDNYMIDLNELISEEKLNMFDPEIIQDLCIENGKLVGLVIINILNKYIIEKIHINIIMFLFYKQIKSQLF